MAQVTAGETLTLTLDTGRVTIKVEDASKSDSILAKIVQSDSEPHRVGEVMDFDRELLKGAN